MRWTPEEEGGRREVGGGGEEWGDESRGRYYVNYHTMTDDCGAWTNDCKPYGRNVAASTMMNDLGGIGGWE